MTHLGLDLSLTAAGGALIVGGVACRNRKDIR